MIFYFAKIRSGAEKIEAEVIKYVKEKGPMRNDYTRLYYPYVKIDLENDEYAIRKLRYADSSSKPFKIGEKIHVFWYNNDLLYWDTYNRGLYKLLPEKWFHRN
ncbi:hypothetical protein ABW636_15780 [Aquimarina sp. 2201CG1-2-11]|uniref:hypothetical protein n=1 Tax=Aquimarina discodermiae TaxID=3231043 RepID=UPI003461EC79